MDNLAVHLKSLKKYTVYFLLICSILYLLLPQYRAYMLGLGLGVAVGFINAQYLAVKIIRLTSPDESKQHRQLNVVNIGFLTRAAMAVLAAMLAMRTDYIEVATVVLGLIVVPVIALVAGLIALRNDNS